MHVDRCMVERYICMDASEYASMEGSGCYDAATMPASPLKFSSLKCWSLVTKYCTSFIVIVYPIIHL